jgi:hypothetical protein
MSPDSLVHTPAEQARSVVLQMMAERGRGSFAAKISLASRLALIDPAVVKALHALRGVRNDFAHSAGDTSLAAPRKRLAPAYAEARANPLWPPLEAILEAQGDPDTDQRQFNLLVTVLVAFIESCTRLQEPFQPRATVRFSHDS